MEGNWLSIEEGAKYLGVSRSTIYRWIKKGLLPRYKVGKVARIKKEDLDRLMEEGEE